MQREFSAGGIVLNSQGQVLLTQHSSNHYWSFPKGHIEKGEDSKTAALREVKEEAGIEAEILEKIGESKYVYTDKEGNKIFKLVIIYLMKYISGDPKDHDWEVEEAIWLDPQEALKKLSFSNDKVLLKKVLENKEVSS